MRTCVRLLASVYLLSIVSPAFAASVPEQISPYQTAIQYAQDHSILKPMWDGLIHAEVPISRQDLVIGIVRDVYKNDIRPDCFDRISPSLPARFTHLFSDISLANPSAQEICVGMFVGLVDGQRDGSFRPQESANLVEAAKVITKAYGIAPLPSLRRQTGVPWHEPYWFALAKRGAIPESVTTRDSALTRGEFAEIMYRLREERPTQGFRYQLSQIQTETISVLSKQESSQTSFYSSLPTTNQTLAPTQVSFILLHAEERHAKRIAKLQNSAASVISKTIL